MGTDRVPGERGRRLAEIFEEYYIDPTNNHDTSNEDAGLYLLDENDPDYKPIRRFCTLTQGTGNSGLITYAYADFDDVESAKRKALEYINDDIFSEAPIGIVDLDTGERYVPRWETVEWAILSEKGVT